VVENFLLFILSKKSGVQFWSPYLHCTSDSLNFSAGVVCGLHSCAGMYFQELSLLC
jgi:hypothetical protein